MNAHFWRKSFINQHFHDKLFVQFTISLIRVRKVDKKHYPQEIFFEIFDNDPNFLQEFYPKKIVIFWVGKDCLQQWNLHTIDVRSYIVYAVVADAQAEHFFPEPLQYAGKRLIHEIKINTEAILFLFFSFLENLNLWNPSNLYII